MSPQGTAAETTSYPVKFSIGTGSQILSSILPTCLSAEYEVIIVTCFWAKSKSRDDVSSMLKQLSDKALSQNRKIRVRVCMSSVSFVQKLLQTTSLNGMVYIPSKWTNIGLPDPSELRGLDMVVKSVFIRPFSVMHPKFILVDREIAFMPSCNVSWEDWFEGCIEMKGDIANRLFDFWKDFWSSHGCEVPKDLKFKPDAPLITNSEPPEPEPPTEPEIPPFPLPIRIPPLIKQTTFSFKTPTSTILLPSPHHKNPKFRPLIKPYPPPTTPLNDFLLQAVNEANSSIYIQTPNLTCGPLISAVLSAVLDRGIDINIVTSRRMMILEQLVTAGTITEFEVWKLRRRYKHYVKKYRASREQDPESALLSPGTLKVGYFKVRQGDDNGEAEKGEPVQSHLKLVIVDEETVVLGSGNQDRASWYTSQELGVAFLSRTMAMEVKACVEEALEGRIEKYL